MKKVFSYIFRDKRATVKNAAIGVISAVILAVSPLIIEFIKGKPEPRTQINQNGGSSNTNIVSHNGNVSYNNPKTLQEYRTLGEIEGYKSGFSDGFNTVAADNHIPVVPEDILNKMFPPIRGFTFAARRAKVKELCTNGSLAEMDACRAEVMFGMVSKHEKGKVSTEKLEKKKLKDQELAKKGMGTLVINYSFAFHPKLDGTLGSEEIYLRSHKTLFLLCSKTTGCEIVDFDKYFPNMLKYLNGRKLVKGVRPIHGEAFTEYRIRMTSLYLQSKIIPISDLEIVAMLKSLKL